MRKAVLSSFVVWLSSAAVAGGRVHRAWTVEDLRAASDLVVIATPEATRDTAIKTELQDLTPALPVVELRTDFRILSILKGELAARRTLRLRHYRLDLERIGSGCLNCGGLIRFSEAAPATQICGAGEVSRTLPLRCDYLLFLKQEDGAWVPTSGDVFPGYSVLLVRAAG